MNIIITTRLSLNLADIEQALEQYQDIRNRLANKEKWAEIGKVSYDRPETEQKGH